MDHVCRLRVRTPRNEGAPPRLLSVSQRSCQMFETERGNGEQVPRPGHGGNPPGLRRLAGTFPSSRPLTRRASVSASCAPWRRRQCNLRNHASSSRKNPHKTGICRGAARIPGLAPSELRRGSTVPPPEEHFQPRSGPSCRNARRNDPATFDPYRIPGGKTHYAPCFGLRGRIPLTGPFRVHAFGGPGNTLPGEKLPAPRRHPESADMPDTIGA